MALIDVINNLDIDPNFSSADHSLIISAITTLYNNSPTARAMLDLITPTSQLKIVYSPGNFWVIDDRPAPFDKIDESPPKM